MWIFRWIILIVVLFFLMGFLLQNSYDHVSVRVLGWTSPEWPLAYMLFLAGFVGYVISFLVAIVNQIRLRMQIAQLRRENRQVRAIEEDETTPFERDTSRPTD
jgi:uncharacterized integral membrane protein